MTWANAVVAFLLGASIGSFLNVVADRLPSGQSLLRPPSHCPGCGRRLSAWELAPVFSYVALRGRCYKCRAAIPPRVVAVELVLGVLALYLWSVWGVSLAVLLVFGFSGLLLAMGVIDLEHGIIPDLLVYPGLVLALIVSPWWTLAGLQRDFLGSAGQWDLLVGSLLGGAVGGGFFSVVILLFPKGMGWGDAKMGGMIGLLTGVPGTLVALLVALASGGAAAVLLLALRLRGRRETMPFGPFLATGGVVAMLWGTYIWRWYVSLW